MKKQKISSIILIILTIIVTYLLMKDNYKEILLAIRNVNFIWIILTIVIYIIYLILQTIPFHDFVKLYNNKIDFSYMFYIIIATNFFNGITPLATGGQPLQVYELHKKDLSTVDASNAVIQNSIIYQIAIVLWSILAIIINYVFHIFTITPILRDLMIIGVTLNIILLLLFILISFSKTFNEHLINGIINLLTKIHLVKNPQKQKEKWHKTCTEFYNNSQILIKNKKLLLKGILLLLIAFAFYYSIPLTIAYALHCEENLTILTSIILSSFSNLSSNYLPIPGATGGMEYAFLGYFKNYIQGFNLKALLILWRFITYYLPTIIGGIVFNIYSIKFKKESS